MLRLPLPSQKNGLKKISFVNVSLDYIQNITDFQCMILRKKSSNF